MKELASIAYKAKKISEDINSLNYNNKEEFILGMTEIKAKLKNKKDGTNADIIQKRIDNKNPTKSDESRLFEVVESSLLNTKLKKASEDKFNSIKLFIKNKKDMLRQLEKKKKTNESV